MEDISKIMAESRSEWNFTLSNAKCAEDVKAIFLTACACISVLSEKIDMFVKTGIPYDEAVEKVEISEDDVSKVASHLSGWKLETLLRTVKSEESVNSLIEASRNVQFRVNSEKQHQIFGRFLDLYCIAPIISDCLKMNNVEKPVIFDCVSTLYQEAMIVGIGQLKWGYKDIKEIAMRPDTAIISLVNQVSGEKQTEKFVENITNFLFEKINNNEVFSPE